MDKDYITTPEEDAYDLECCQKAMEEHKKNPVAYTVEEITELLELEE